MGQTTVDVGQAQGGQFTVAAAGTKNGETSELVINYSVKTPWVQNNFIKMKFPKLNLLYKSGASNTPASLVTSTSYKTAVISINGTPYAIEASQSFFSAGSAWTEDTVLWGFQSGGPTLTATNIPLIIKIPITMMPVVTTLNTGFTFEILNSAGVVITGPTDANLKAVELAVDPLNPSTGTPFTGALTTSTFPTTTSGS